MLLAPRLAARRPRVIAAILRALRDLGGHVGAAAAVGRPSRSFCE